MPSAEKCSAKIVASGGAGKMEHFIESLFKPAGKVSIMTLSNKIRLKSQVSPRVKISFRKKYQTTQFNFGVFIIP